jgi:hypothetical protein
MRLKHVSVYICKNRKSRRAIFLCGTDFDMLNTCQSTLARIEKADVLFSKNSDLNTNDEIRKKGRFHLSNVALLNNEMSKKKYWYTTQKENKLTHFTFRKRKIAILQR